MPANTSRSTRPDPLADANARVDALCENVRKLAAMIDAHFAACASTEPEQREALVSLVRRMERCGR